MSDVAPNPTDDFAAARAVGAIMVEGILSRRLVAWLIDVVILTVISALLAVTVTIAGIITFGLGWHLFVLLPIVPFVYAFGFLASATAATPGQQICGLRVIHHTTGLRPTPLEAFISTLVFFASLAVFAPLALIALFTERKRTLQDIVAGLLMIRTAPLTPSLAGWTNRIRP